MIACMTVVRQDFKENNNVEENGSGIGSSIGVVILLQGAARIGAGGGQFRQGSRTGINSADRSVPAGFFRERDGGREENQYPAVLHESERGRRQLHQNWRSRPG